ncbi:MAG TPA: DUF3606 domain-containing protein [Novosphingobium sp.]
MSGSSSRRWKGRARRSPFAALPRKQWQTTQTARGPQDRARIALGEDYVVDCWTGKFGVSR